MDVFISYASEDREQAHHLASALQTCGWSVWWDRKIVAGQSFDQIIERELDAAKCVVVLWSKNSVASEWVKNEAAVAAERGALVPALIDRIKPPLEFRRKQTVDLVTWDGNVSDAAFQALCDGVAAITKTRASARPESSTQPVSRSRHFPWLIGAMALTLALVLEYWIFIAQEPQQSFPIDYVDKEYHTTGKTKTSEPRGINNPRLIALGVIHKVTLDGNETSYFKLPSPVKDLKIILDMRLFDKISSNLISNVSVLDQDGGVIKTDAIRFNQVDLGHRITTVFSSRQPHPVVIKLLNGRRTADFWLTVLKEPTSQLVPFFGEVVPKPLMAEKDASGTLHPNENEDVYYISSLRKGNYKIILDFVNSDRKRTNIIGYLALLDPDGGGQRKILTFNELDVEYRKVAMISLKEDARRIIKIHNGRSVEYTLKIIPHE